MHSVRFRSVVGTLRRRRRSLRKRWRYLRPRWRFLRQPKRSLRLHPRTIYSIATSPLILLANTFFKG